MDFEEKCIICGQRPFSESVSDKQQKIFSSWKRKCSKSLSDVLFGSDTDPLFQYFNSGSYCHICQQIVRDLNYTKKLLKSLENKIEFLSRCLRKRLFENYQNFEEKSEENLIEERMQTFRDKDDDTFGRRTYNEIVEVLHLAASRFCGNLNLFQGDTKEDMKYLQYAASNYVCVKMEPVDKETDKNSNFENDDRMESISNDNVGLSDQIKTDECQVLNRSSGPSSRKSRNRSLKRKAAARIKNTVTDYSKNEEKEKDENEIKCREKCDRKNQVRREKRKMDPNHYKRLKCTYGNCKIAFMTEGKREIHIRQTHLGEQKPFVCTKCSKSFRSRQGMGYHMRQFHSGDRDYNHFCKFCGKGYKNEDELKSHCVGHQGPNPFTCVFCNKMYSNATDLHKHVSDSHPNYERPQCDICKKFFASLFSLKIHKLVHKDPELLHKCEICNRIFATLHRLKAHKDTHNEDNNFVCEFCGKSFRHKMALRSHSEYHTKEKRFKCKVCGMGFIKPGSCRKHEITHSGIKEFICKTCGKAFSIKHNLNDHEKIHERERDPTVVVRERKPNKQINIPEPQPQSTHLYSPYL